MPAKEHAILSFPNHVDATFYPVAFSGGNWVPSLPLTNLRDPQLAKVARSVDATLAATQFDVDLGITRPIRLFAIPSHNITIEGRLRITGSDSPPGTASKNLYTVQAAGGTIKGFANGAGSLTDATLEADGWLRIPRLHSEGMQHGEIHASTDVPVTVGTTYTQSLLLRTDNGAAADSVVNDFSFFTANGHFTVAPTYENLGGGVYRLTASYTARTGDNQLRMADLTLDTAFTGFAHLEVKDIQLEEGDTFTGYEDPNETYLFRQTYNTGWLDVWTVVYTHEGIDWEHPSFWFGTLGGEEAEDYDIAFLHIADEAKDARYWRFEIDDTLNPDGYVELSRLFMAPGWQPTKDMALGPVLGVETETTAERSLGGVDYYDRQKPRRTVRFELRNLPEDEALAQAFEIQRRLGIDRQLYYVWDPHDAINLHRRSFLATMRELTPLEFPLPGRAATAFQLEEVL